MKTPPVSTGSGIEIYMEKSESQIKDMEEKPLRAFLPWVALTALVFMFAYQARAIFGPLLPYIEADFNLSHAEATRYQLYISIGYSISMFATVYTASRIRYRRLGSLANILGGLIMIVMAFTPNTTVLILLCVALGLATGQYFNAGMGTIRTLVSVKQWSKAISIHEFGPNLCFLLCPLIAVAGAEWIGWRGLLAVLGILTMLSGCIFLLIGKGGDITALPFRFDGLRQILRNPLFWAFVILMSLLICGQFGPYSVMILHLTEECGLSEANASALLSSSRILAPVAVFFGAFLTLRLGSRSALAICVSCHALALFALTCPLMAVKIPAMFIQPMAAAMSAPPGFTMLAERLAPRKQTVALAIGMPLASFIGTGAAPSLLGLCGTYLNFSAGFAMLGILATAALLTLRMLRYRGERRR